MGPGRQLVQVDAVGVGVVQEDVRREPAGAHVVAPADVAPRLEPQRVAELVHLIDFGRAGDRGDPPPQDVLCVGADLPAADPGRPGVLRAEVEAVRVRGARIDPVAAFDRGHVAGGGRRTEHAAVAGRVDAGDVGVVQRLGGHRLAIDCGAGRNGLVDRGEVAEEGRRVAGGECREQARVIDDVLVVVLLVHGLERSGVVDRRRDLAFVADPPVVDRGGQPRDRVGLPVSAERIGARDFRLEVPIGAAEGRVEHQAARNRRASGAQARGHAGAGIGAERDVAVLDERIVVGQAGSPERGAEAGVQGQVVHRRPVQADLGVLGGADVAVLVDAAGHVELELAHQRDGVALADKGHVELGEQR